MNDLSELVLSSLLEDGAEEAVHALRLRKCVKRRLAEDQVVLLAEELDLRKKVVHQQTVEDTSDEASCHG